MHPSDQSLLNCHYNKASLLLSPPCQELLWFSPGFHRLLIAAPPCSSKEEKLKILKMHFSLQYNMEADMLKILTIDPQVFFGMSGWRCIRSPLL